jgi:antitoxin component YwqK of YwqJK toxin-antitoxin module
MLHHCLRRWVGFALSLLVLLSACDRAPREAAYEDLEWKNDVYLLAGQPFTGIARAVHANGKPKAEYPFVDGRFHGVVREWWENGQQSVETHFENGQRHGSNRYWNAEGKLTKEQVYDHDHSVSEKHY